MTKPGGKSTKSTAFSEEKAGKRLFVPAGCGNYNAKAHRE
jgi:hypothetical protein